MNTSLETSPAADGNTETNLSTLELYVKSEQEISDEKARDAERAQNRAAIEKGLEEQHHFPSAFLKLREITNEEQKQVYWIALQKVANEKKLFSEPDEKRELIFKDVWQWLSPKMQHERYGEHIDTQRDLVETCDAHYLQLILEQAHSLPDIQSAAKEAFENEVQKADELDDGSDDDYEDINKLGDNHIKNTDTISENNLTPDELQAQFDQPTEATEPLSAGSSSFFNNGSSSKDRVPIQSSKERVPIVSTKTHAAAQAIMRRRSTSKSSPASKSSSINQASSSR